MARHTWHESASSGFADLDPTHEEIEDVIYCIEEILNGNASGAPIPFEQQEFAGHFVIECSRFALVYRHHSKDIEIVDVVPAGY